MSNFMKIRPVGAQSSHADRRMDGQTDMTKLSAAFCHFANAPNSSRLFRYAGVTSRKTIFSPPMLRQSSTSRTIHSRRPQWRQHCTVRYRNRGPVSDAVSCGNPLVCARYLAESTDRCLADRPPQHLPPTVAGGAKWTAGN
jgi:hypothetical protein